MITSCYTNRYRRRVGHEFTGSRGVGQLAREAVQFLTGGSVQIGIDDGQQTPDSAGGADGSADGGFEAARKWRTKCGGQSVAAGPTVVTETSTHQGPPTPCSG